MAKIAPAPQLLLALLGAQVDVLDKQIVLTELAMETWQLVLTRQTAFLEGLKETRTSIRDAKEALEALVPRLEPGSSRES